MVCSLVLDAILYVKIHLQGRGLIQVLSALCKFDDHVAKRLQFRHRYTKVNINLTPISIEIQKRRSVKEVVGLTAEIILSGERMEARLGSPVGVVLTLNFILT